MSRARTGRGLWAHADPRARLLSACVVSGAVLAAPGPAALGAALGGVLLLLAASGAGGRAVLGALRPFRVLLAFTLVVQLALTPGTPLLPGALPFVTREGAAASALALLRLAGVIVASARLVATTSPLELARSLGWAIAPAARLGVPVREATLVTALAFHFFPVLLDESRQVRAALESRGVSLRHPVLRLRARAVLSWTLALLFGMVERSTRLAAALEARGFSLPAAPRHRFPAWRRESTLVIAAALAAAAASLALR